MAGKAVSTNVYYLQQAEDSSASLCVPRQRQERQDQPIATLPCSGHKPNTEKTLIAVSLSSRECLFLLAIHDLNMITSEQERCSHLCRLEHEASRTVMGTASRSTGISLVERLSDQVTLWR
jgi:hypothetical protein